MFYNGVNEIGSGVYEFNNGVVLSTDELTEIFNELKYFEDKYPLDPRSEITNSLFKLVEDGYSKGYDHGYDQGRIDAAE